MEDNGVVYNAKGDLSSGNATYGTYGVNGAGSIELVFTSGGNFTFQGTGGTSQKTLSPGDIGATWYDNLVDPNDNDAYGANFTISSITGPNYDGNAGVSSGANGPSNGQSFSSNQSFTFNATIDPSEEATATWVMDITGSGPAAGQTSTVTVVLTLSNAIAPF